MSSPLEIATHRYQHAARELAAAAKELRRLSAAGLDPAARPEVQIIQRVVSDHFRMPVDLLWRRDKHEPIVTARMQAMVITRRITQLSFQEIATAYKRDHGTVMSAVTSVANRCDTDARYRAAFEQLLAKCERELAVEEAA